jgi:DNA-binding MarR family transcriptional regulator/energy-coupling factor transporter ATP-binding protein EcfA2
MVLDRWREAHNLAIIVYSKCRKVTTPRSSNPPDLSGRPLAGTRLDRPLFVNRDEELKRVRASIQRRSNTLVYGERGAGKTSFLRQIDVVARSLNLESVFIDASPAQDVGSLIGLIRWRMNRSPLFNPLAAAAASFGSREVRGEAEETILLIRSLADQDSVDLKVLLLDEPERQIAHALFGRLRDEVWQLPFVWVVAVDEAAVPSILQPPADAFFGTRIELGALSRDASIEFLHRRIGSGRVAPKRDLVQLAEAADGNPRRLIELAREYVIDGRKARDIAASRLEDDAALKLLGTPAQRMVDVLRERGSVSASDEDALARLGWTRPRATQVLNQLEKAGFVTATSVKGGRRKVYTLRSRSG